METLAKVAVCRIIETYYAPDGTKRLHHGTLTDGDAGQFVNTNRVAVYLNGSLVNFALTAFRGTGGLGWVVIYRTDGQKLVLNDNGDPVAELLTGKVEVLIGAKHPYAERIDR